MEKHYFIGEGPESEKIIAATLARREVATEARRKLMEDYGADGLIKRDWGGGMAARSEGKRYPCSTGEVTVSRHKTHRETRRYPRFSAKLSVSRQNSGRETNRQETKR